MDDDSDMHAMHLTARAYDQLERQAGLQSQNCSCMQLRVFVLVLLLIPVCSPELAKIPALSSRHSCYGGQGLIQAFAHVEDASDRIRQRAGAGADDGWGCPLVPQEPG